MTTTAREARSNAKIRAQRRAQTRRRTRRLMEQAKVLYAELIQKLGGRCALCPNTQGLPLTVDHVNGHGWPKPHRAYRFDERVRRYCREYEEGVKLRCLCMRCNSGYRPPNYKMPGREPGEDEREAVCQSETDLEAAPF